MAQNSPFCAWNVFTALAAIAAVNLGGTYLGAAVINAPIAKDLGLIRGTLGLASTFFVLCIALSVPLVARMVNPFGARATLCTGSLRLDRSAGDICESGVALCRRLWDSAGAGCSFGSMVGAQSCATLWFEKRRAMALALVLVGAGVGGSVSAHLLTSVIATAHGNWRAGWFCPSAAGLTAALVSILFVKNRPEDVGQVADEIPADVAAGRAFIAPGIAGR